MFTDRPVRAAEHMTTKQFIPFWSEGKNSFLKDPPNAALSFVDAKEMIDVVMKSREDLSKIGHILRLQREKPVPEGRLLVTRYDIYFIQDGKILWDGKVINEPVKAGDKLYIASGEYVFCAQNDGPVLWKAKIDNDGILEVAGNRIKVTSNGKRVTLDSVTGRKL